MSGHHGAPPPEAFAAPNLRHEPRSPRSLGAEIPLARTLPSPDTSYGALIGALIFRRQQLKLNQLDVDRIAGFTPYMTGKFESGARRPTAFSLCIWASSLNAIPCIAALSAPRDLAALAELRPWQQKRRKRRAKAA